MPQLTNVRVRPTLTNLSLGYQNQDFIADRIFPIVSRETMTGDYYVSGMEMFTRESDIRGLKDRANAVDHDYRKQSYAATEHSLLEEIPEPLIEEARVSGFANVLNLERDAQNVVDQKLALGREIDFATKLRNIATYAAGNSTTLVGTAQWSDLVNSDPVVAIDSYQETVRTKVGRRPNLGILPRPVFRKLRAHPKMKTEAGQKDGGSLSEQQVADVLELDRILVPASIQNTVAPNINNNFTSGDVWGTDAMFLNVADGIGLGTLSFGFLFRIRYPNTKMLAESRSWDEEDRRLRVIEGNYREDRHIAMPEAGYLVKTAVA